MNVSRRLVTYRSSFAALAASSPRNHWWQLSQAFDFLGRGRPLDAWRILEAVRYSSLISPEVIGHADRLIRSVLKGGAEGPRNLPCDYLRRLPVEKDSLLVPRSLSSSRPQLRASPYEMVLPRIMSNCNDFAYLADSLGRSEFTGAIPQRRLRLITWLERASDVTRLQSLLEQRHADLSKLPCLDLVVFAAVGLAPQMLPRAARWHEGAPWRMSRPAQRDLADGTDVLLFLPPSALADAFLTERVVRAAAFSDRLCQVLIPLPVAVQTGGQHAVDAPSESVLCDELLQKHWRGLPEAFRRVDRLAFAVDASRFHALGGFDPRFETEFFACREFAARLYNQGIYFVPVAVRADLPHAKGVPDVPDDKLLLTELSPHPWDRKSLRAYEVPKVSIYVPAYRASRYLRHAIDSVLSQDFADLEVCVADDGSPDETLGVLESYRDDPRVHWSTGPNGGIGSASNRAIRMTRGLYIGQLDSDDRLKPGAVRRLAEFLDENPSIGCVYASCERIDAAGKYLQKEYSWSQFSREKMMLTSIVHHFRMFRRQVWERTEGFREDIVNGVDYDMFLKMSEVTEFKHLDEVLYQRRWHGENTSLINEDFQTQNTYRAQREALRRLGLDRYWDVHVPDPSSPRVVSYQRKGNGARVIFWPDYSRSNPYQRLLYARAQQHGEILSGDIDAALRAIREVTPGASSRVTFHLHWLNKILQDSNTLGNAVDKVLAFLDNLGQFKACGGRIVWTIHNTLSHDLPFPEIERGLSREVLRLSDAVHIHCEASLPEIDAQFKIPREKLVVHRHGSYVGAYPDFVDRDRARVELGLATDDEVILFLGQIRPYKQLGGLIAAFMKMAPQRPALRLVVAGRGPIDDLLGGVPPAIRNRIHVFNRFIDDMELQLFFRAADFAVFPYRSILTSGSLLASLSFGLPAIVPDCGMTRTVLQDEDCGVLYAPDDGTRALLGALGRMLKRRDAGEGPAMAAAARRFAEAETWDDIGPMLFGAEP